MNETLKGRKKEKNHLKKVRIALWKKNFKRIKHWYSLIFVVYAAFFFPYDVYVY